jgi:hypothetical protein
VWCRKEKGRRDAGATWFYPRRTIHQINGFVNSQLALLHCASAFSGLRLSAIIRRMADEKQKRPSPYVASRIIRVIGFTFVVIWLFYVLYADPTRGTVNIAVSRTYLSLGSLFILLVFAFNAVANCVKMLEERLRRLEEAQTQSQNQGKDC